MVFAEPRNDVRAISGPFGSFDVTTTLIRTAHKPIVGRGNCRVVSTIKLSLCARASVQGDERFCTTHSSIATAGRTWK